MICHIAYVIDGQPYCTPTAFWREDDHLYWHASSASRMLRSQRDGLPVCLTVTHLDSLVLARCGFNHSVDYRSAMCFGTAHIIDEPAEKSAALDRMVDRFYPGRAETLRTSTALELKATTVIGMAIESSVRQNPLQGRWRRRAGLCSADLRGALSGAHSDRRGRALPADAARRGAAGGTGRVLARSSPGRDHAGEQKDDRAAVKEATNARAVRATKSVQLEVHSDAIDAIAEMRWWRPIIEHVAEMTAAVRAMHLGSYHAVTAIDRRLDRTFDRIIEAGPPSAALELQP